MKIVNLTWQGTLVQWYGGTVRLVRWYGTMVRYGGTVGIPCHAIYSCLFLTGYGTRWYGTVAQWQGTVYDGTIARSTHVLQSQEWLHATWFLK